LGNQLRASFPHLFFRIMTVVHFLAAAAAEAPATGNPLVDIPNQFGLNAWGFVCQVISFGIVAFLLYRFAYHPILAVLEERRKRIEDGLANATKVEQKLAEAQVASQAILSRANDEATRMIEEARAAAKQVSERENQRAVAQAGEIIQKAREAGEAEQKRLMAELKKELSRLIVETTARVTGKVLTSGDQKKITEEATRELAA
jgi:F-type H+-transporting ATPase subunit b